MTIEKIPLPFADLLGQKVLEKRTHCLELHEGYLRWTYEAWCNYQEEEGEAWYERLMQYDWIIKKSAITALQCNYTETPSYYKVVITISGSNEDVDIYFKKQDNAKELFDRLLQWISE